MDYNKSIPNIYSIQTSDKNNKNIKYLEISLLPYEYKEIDISRYYLIHVQTEYKNIKLNNNSIWNNQIIFSKNNLYLLTLQNNNDIQVIIKLNVLLDYLEKNLIRSVIQNMYIFTKVEQLIISYMNLSILNNIKIKTKSILSEKVIKFVSFNYNVFYKVNKLNKLNNNEYILNLWKIKNSFTDEYAEINNYDTNNLYDLYDEYDIFMKKLSLLQTNNVEYVKKNNIIIPQDIRDEDGWDNMFYSFNKNEFMKKYDVQSYELYYIRI
jgi:hypothetical protein